MTTSAASCERLRPPGQGGDPRGDVWPQLPRQGVTHAVEDDSSASGIAAAVARLLAKGQEKFTRIARNSGRREFVSITKFNSGSVMRIFRPTNRGCNRLKADG